MKVYEIVKTEKRFNLEISYIQYINITAFFKTNCFKTEKFHPCICVYSPDFITHMMAKQWSTSQYMINFQDEKDPMWQLNPK